MSAKEVSPRTGDEEETMRRLIRCIKMSSYMTCGPRGCGSTWSVYSRLFPERDRLSPATFEPVYHTLLLDHLYFRVSTCCQQAAWSESEQSLAAFLQLTEKVFISLPRIPWSQIHAFIIVHAC